MYEAERIGELNAVMVIPRLLEDLEHTLPVASCWLDKPEPLPMLLPNKVKEKEKQPLQLPDFGKVPMKVELEPLEEEEGEMGRWVDGE